MLRLRATLVDLAKTLGNYFNTGGKHNDRRKIDAEARIDNIFRVHYKKRRRVSIITPTTGKACLADALTSVNNQNYKDLSHVVVVDGPFFEQASRLIISEAGSDKTSVLTLPFNTGNHGFNGHRIYAAMSFLNNSDYVLFLDEDNWFEEDHVESLVGLIEDKKLDWAYSLRKIYTHDNMFVTNDDCESIGPYPSFSSRFSFLVDTNCYCVRRKVLAQVGNSWYHTLGADRSFFRRISKEFPRYETTGLHTCNYRLTPGRLPNADFFLKGNRFMHQKFNGTLPWHVQSSVNS